MGVPAIIAALPREVAGLVRGVRADAGRRTSGIFSYVMPHVVVVCAGMGAGRATLAVEAALRLGEISMLLTVGLAGACHCGMGVSSVVEARTVVDSLSGERFTTACSAGATLVTTHTIAGVREKERLHASYGADIVDMEAATVARLAAMRGLPFRAIKAVSDAHDFELSSLGRFASQQGHFRMGAFALHTALRPQHWRKTIQLGGASQRALQALTEALKSLGEEGD